MLSLTWWGKVSSTNEEWRLAVTDVTAALCCLCESTQHRQVDNTSGRKSALRSLLANRQGNYANEAINNRGLHPYSIYPRYPNDCYLYMIIPHSNA
jgi:hypothetical protein